MSTSALPKFSIYVVLGSSGSLKGIVSVLPLMVMGGGVSKMGDRIRLLVRSFRSISSSKVSTICLLLKLTVESAGSALISKGGRESLGPPEGGMILAQPVGTDVQ